MTTPCALKCAVLNSNTGRFFGVAFLPPEIVGLMATHHGSDKSNVPELARWAKPKLVVSSQAAPLNERASVKMYEKLGARFLGTWPHGAVTLRASGVETYRTKVCWQLP